MKTKQHIFWALVTCLISCEKMPVSIVGSDMVPVEFSATLDDDISTKTNYVASDHIALWKREDMVGVIAGYGSGSFTDAVMFPFSIKEKNNKGQEFLQSATFSGTLTDKGMQDYTYYAVSPFKAFQSVSDASAISSRLEERQFPGLKSWDGACDMLASKPVTVTSSSVAGENLQLQFTRLFGMLRLDFGESITDKYGTEVVETISIESINDKDILAGNFTVDLTSSDAPDSVMSTEQGEHFNKVTLDYCGKNVPLSKIDAYFILNQGTYSDVTITVKTKDHTISFPRKGLTVIRGCIASATMNWKQSDLVTDSEPILPKEPSSLKIFTFGNSFTSNSMNYIDDLMNASGITNVTFAHFYIGGSSLSTHWSHVTNKGNTKGGTDQITYVKRYYNGTKVIESTGTKTVIEALCDEPWDVVVLQTVSNQIGFYDQFAQYIPKMIDYIKSTCMTENGKSPIIAWHMAWAFGTHSDKLGSLYYGNQALNYEAHVESAKKVMRNSEIQLVITTGTAIQNLRNSSWNNPYSGTDAYEFLSDGLHLDTSGQYAVACTWFEFFMKPCFGKTILGNTYMPPTSYAGVPVTAENRETLQRAAVLACQNPFEISHLDVINPMDITASTEIFESAEKGNTETFTIIDNLTW